MRIVLILIHFGWWALLVALKFTRITFLTLYDRLLGTYTPAGSAQFVTYGLDDADPARLGSFSGLLSMPFGERKRTAYTKVRVPVEHGL